MALLSRCSQIEEIERRQDGVAEFAQNMISRAEVRRTLKCLADLAKLTSKIALNLASPHHLLNLNETLRQIPVIKKEIENLQAAILREITAGLDELEPVVERHRAGDRSKIRLWKWAAAR